MSDAATARLDAFTDAAFAFAVTLLIAGGGGAVDIDALRRVVASIPAFAIGFSIIAMFWVSHVRWRNLRGPGDWRSQLLTLALVFAVLLYILPLRAMAAAFASYLGAGGEGFRGDIGELFSVYGGGFLVMSGITALLFRDALRNPELAPSDRASAGGQVWIWAMLAGLGLVSIILANNRATAIWAPWAYALSPGLIGLFVWRWNWDGDQGAGTA